MAKTTNAESTIGIHRYQRMDYSDGYKRVIYQPGRVARIIMNRPRYKNALSHPHLAEIEDAFGRADADPECHVIVLSGAGDCFSAGDDALGLTPESAPVMASREETPEQMMKRYGSEGQVWRYYQDEHFWLLAGQHGRLRLIMKPTIAMVHGYCIFNAFSLAQAMDLIFASEDALFLSTGGSGLWEGGSYRKALELAYEHRFMTARECMEMGIVNRIYPDYETLEKETLAFAERIADNPVSGHRTAKAGIYHHLDLQGFSTAYHDQIMNGLAYGTIGTGGATPIRDVDEADRHRERHEGRGRARTPIALRNLKLKLESEGKKVPQNVLAAVARAAQRDDRGAYQRALAQEWREKEHIERAERDRKAYEKMIAEREAAKAKEKKGASRRKA